MQTQMQGMAVDLSMLRGEALREEIGGEDMLRHLPAAAMPADPAARFAALFAVKPRWELPDLEPYLADLQVRMLPALGACVPAPSRGILLSKIRLEHR